MHETSSTTTQRSFTETKMPYIHRETQIQHIFWDQVYKKKLLVRLTLDHEEIVWIKCESDVAKDCVLSGQEQAGSRITQLAGCLSPCQNGLIPKKMVVDTVLLIRAIGETTGPWGLGEIYPWEIYPGEMYPGEIYPGLVWSTWRHGHHHMRSSQY